MSFAPSKSDDLTFNGNNWEDLNRIIGLSKFKFIVDSSSFETDQQKCAYIAGAFSGPALDWVSGAFATQGTLFNDLDAFITNVRQTFGVHDNNIIALNRKKLDDLKWASEVPTFFAEFDRLCSVLSIEGHATKIAMVEAKLPHHIKQKFAEQALSFANYDTMRERLGTMWALGDKGATSTTKTKKPRCGNCGKKGHTASDCRSDKK